MQSVEADADSKMAADQESARKRLEGRQRTRTERTKIKEAAEKKEETAAAEDDMGTKKKKAAPKKRVKCLYFEFNAEAHVADVAVAVFPFRARNEGAVRELRTTP